MTIPRMLATAVLAAALGGVTVATAATAVAAPGDVAITAPGADGEDTTPLITGTADPSLPVHLLLEGTEVAELAVTPEGAWQYEVDEPLPLGEAVSITALVLDASGEEIGQAHSSYFVWPAPVTVAITAPEQGAIVGHTIELTGTWSQPHDGLVLEVDGEPTEAALAQRGDQPGLWITHLWDHGLSDGTHAFQVVGQDVVGRTIASAVVTLVVDATEPAPPVVTSPAAGSTVRDVDVVFAGTGTPGDQVVVRFAGSGEPITAPATVGADGRWVAPILVDVDGQGNPLLWRDDPEYTVDLEVFEIDAVGNSAAVAHSFLLDLREPTSPTAEDPDDAPTGTAGPEPAASPSQVPAPAPQQAAPSPAPSSSAELAETGSLDLRVCCVSLALVCGGLALRRRAALAG